MSTASHPSLSANGLGRSIYARSNASTEPELELEKDLSATSSVNEMNSPPTPPIKQDLSEPSVITIRRAETSLFPQLAKQNENKANMDLAAYAEEEEDEAEEGSEEGEIIENGVKPVPVTPRPKASIRWNNRMVVISIPVDNRHIDHSEPMPMTNEEIEAKFASFGEVYGTWTNSYNQGEGFSRIVFPEEGHIESPPNVSIPDKKQWEAYCNALREEKLKALGVDLGDIFSTSPAPSEGRLSVPMEKYGNKPISPPPQTNSAASNRTHHSHMRAFSVSPNMSGMMTSPMTGAASPYMPFHGHGHLSRQSMSMARTPPLYGPPGFQHSDQRDGNGFFQPPHSQPTPPLYGQGMNNNGWNPQMQRNTSPGIFGSLSPIPGYHDQNRSPQPVDFSQAGDAGGMFRRHQHRPSQQWQNLQQQMVQQQQQQQQLQQQAAFLQQQQQQLLQQQQQQKPPRPTLESLHEGDEEEEEEERTAPIVVPVPKHGMNRLSVHMQNEMQGKTEHMEAPEAIALPSEESEREEIVEEPSVEIHKEVKQADHEEHPTPNIENPFDDAAAGSSEGHNDETDPEHLQSQAHSRQISGISAVSSIAHNLFHPSPLHSREASIIREAENDNQGSAMSFLSATRAFLGGMSGENMSEDGRTNISDIHTNPSLPPSPLHAYSNSIEKWEAEAEAEPIKLNVEAAEFKFGGDNFASVAADMFSPPQAKTSSVSAHSRGGSSNLSFNVAAPAFKPSTFTPAKEIISPTTDSKVPTSPFSFVSKAGFNPNVATFKPSPNVNENSIFKTFPEIVIPGPKKIIPIVRPKSSDSNGPIVDDRADDRRDEGRGKKARTTTEDIPSLANEESFMMEMEREKEKRDREEQTQFSPRFESYTGNPEDTRKVVEGDQFVFDNSQEAKSFAMARPSSPVPKRLPKKDLFGIFGEEYGDLRNLSVDEAIYAAATTPSLKGASPVQEDAPPLPQVPKTSFNPDAAEFNFDFASRQDAPSPLPIKSNAPISGRLPMPSAQELDDAFNFMFSQDHVAEPDEEEETEDDEVTVDEDEIQQSLFLSPRPAQPILSQEPEHIISPTIRYPISHHRPGASFVMDDGARPIDQDSDWDDMIPQDGEERVKSRSAFFDGHVEGVVDGVLEKRLYPMEKSLLAIQSALTDLSPLAGTMPNGRRKATVESDADDEDDDEDFERSPVRNRKMEKIKIAVLEAMKAQDDKLQKMIQQFTQHNTDGASSVQRSQELEMSLESARREAAEEKTLRRQAEDKIYALERRCKAAEDSEVKQRELSEEADRRLKSAEDKNHQVVTQSQMRNALLEGAHSSLQKTVSELTAQKASLEGLYTDARTTIDRVKSEVEMKRYENLELRRTIPILESSLEEKDRLHENLRKQLEEVNTSIISAASEIENKQVRWRERSDAQRARISTLEARLESEVLHREQNEAQITRLEEGERQGLRSKYELEHVIRIKAKMEADIERLQVEEREAIRLRTESEQIRRDNARLEELADRLRNESIEHQKQAATTRDAAEEEAAKIKTAADEGVLQIRASLEGEIRQLRQEIERVKTNSESAQAKDKQLFDQALEAQHAEVVEFEVAKNVAAQHALDIETSKTIEQHRRHEIQLDDLVSQHEQVLKNVREDSERELSFISERLNISIAQEQKLRETIVTLEDQLDIATKAAKAAAQAAKPAERVSTQALRESIVVLQDQLGERETRIEKLEEEASKFDRNAASAAKEMEHENIFLRELLSVRVTELDEIISQLLQPNFNRNLVRNAAIRLKANIEMEQQERERTSRNNSVVGIAKGALGTLWKGKARYEDANYVSLIVDNNNGSVEQSGISSPTTPLSAGRTRQGFLTGLLTPPTAASIGRHAAKPFLSRATTQPLPQTSSPRPQLQQQEKRSLSQHQQQFMYDDDADSSMLSYDSRSSASQSTVRGGAEEDDQEQGDEDDMLPPGFTRSSPYMMR